MFEENVISKLKQSNISADGEKTKERMRALWKSASAEEKSKITTLADVATITVQRIYKTGSISAKLAVPIAQALNVSPFYLIGEGNEQEECTNDLLKSFLIRFGYEELISDKKGAQKVSSRGKTRRQKLEPSKEETVEADAVVAETVEADAVEAETVEAEAPETEAPEKETPSVAAFAAEVPKYKKTAVDEMSEEEAIALMRAEFIRAKYGVDSAAERVSDLKKRLLSDS